MSESVSITLDLDDLWAYLRVKGDKDWDKAPSYLESFIPVFLKRLKAYDIQATIFVIGKDAEFNPHLIQMLAAEGHEIASHSFNHTPKSLITNPEEEISKAEEAIFKAVQKKPIGFRGPAFTWSKEILQILNQRGYLYDSSLLPSFLGPLARAYYRLKTKTQEQDDTLFGSYKEGFRTNHAHYVKLNGKKILEFPVTTMPFLKSPFHMSYLIYLASINPSLMRAYFQFAIQLCRKSNCGLTFLFHPTDFLDIQTVPQLDFFPGMKMPAYEKEKLYHEIVTTILKNFKSAPLYQRAAVLTSNPETREVTL